MKSHVTPLLACVLLAILVDGCVQREVVYVDGPAPAPVVEEVPPAPSVEVVWVPGIWVRDYHHHWVWHRGYYHHR